MARTAFAVDVSEVYDRKRAALAAYGSIFKANDGLLALYEAEDQYFGRLGGVAYAEIFKAASLLVISDPTGLPPGDPRLNIAQPVRGLPGRRRWAWQSHRSTLETSGDFTAADRRRPLPCQVSGVTSVRRPLRSRAPL